MKTYIIELFPRTRIAVRLQKTVWTAVVENFSDGQWIKKQNLGKDENRLLLMVSALEYAGRLVEIVNSRTEEE